MTKTPMLRLKGEVIVSEASGNTNEFELSLRALTYRGTSNISDFTVKSASCQV
jgi:hypothetical protein